MPDDVKPEGTTEGAKPTIDTDALMSAIDARMKANLQEFVRQPQPEPVIAEPKPAPLADPLGDMVRQAVGADLHDARLAAASAEDKADFYLDHDEAKEHKQEIESMFSKLAKANRPMPRQDIWNYIQGRDFDKFAEKRAARKAKQIDDAAAAATVGDTAGRRDIGTSKRDPYAMSDDELDKAVGGVSF